MIENGPRTRVTESRAAARLIVPSSMNMNNACGFGVGVGVGEGVGVGVGVGVDVGEGDGDAALPLSAFQKPPFKVSVPPLIALDALTSPIVPSTRILPPVLAPPPPATTWGAMGPTTSPAASGCCCVGAEFQEARFTSSDLTSLIGGRDPERSEAANAPARVSRKHASSKNSFRRGWLNAIPPDPLLPAFHRIFAKSRIRAECFHSRGDLLPLSNGLTGQRTPITCTPQPVGVNGRPASSKHRAVAAER